MILAKATWTEVEALDREGVVVVVPIGGTEQHGPSWPLGTSTALAEAVAYGLHEQFWDRVVVVPTIPYGVSGMDKAFAGTVDLGYEAFIATLRAIVLSFVRHRFRKFYFYNGSGEDTRYAMQVALRAMKDERPNLQLALDHLRIVHSLEARASMLDAIQPGTVIVEPSQVEELGLAAEQLLGVSDQFVVDSDEVLFGGEGVEARRQKELRRRAVRAQVSTLEPVHEGQQTLEFCIEAAAEAIEIMLKGRVYVERETEREEGRIGE